MYRIPTSRPSINRKLIVQTSMVSWFRAHQDFVYVVLGLPRPLTTVKCVLLAIETVSSGFLLITDGGCIAAKVFRLAAVRSSVPDAALWNTQKMSSL